MSESLEQAALSYHRYPHPGKIEVVPTKPYDTPEDLALAYSPGVAYPCLEIKENPKKIFDYTNRGNLIAVISNGTAVLGLGNIGAKASKPVMEGKAFLFKIFAGLDAFDIEIDESDPVEFVKTVARLTPTFGGINLEDIKAPECFEIEKNLREKLDIPVMHDDQHGTAIISSAALLNALHIQNKDISKVRVVVNGAGAAAIACTKLFCELGVRHENVVMCDSKGVIRKDRGTLNPMKAEFATDRDLTTLVDAMKGADVFLGLSVADVVTEEMVKSMADRPIVFALANPSPEIAYDLAMASRPDIVFVTGRSDYPNQINNVLGFPYIFRGALDCGATEINEAMKVAAAKAIAALAQQPVPEEIKKAYGEAEPQFGSSYILPKPFDHRLLTVVAPAVIKAAEESGVATKQIEDFDRYNTFLKEIMCTNEALISYLIKAQNTCNMKWEVHMIGHAIGAFTNATHGMTLSGISVAYYRYIMKYAVKRFARFAEVVWGIDSEGKSEEQLASEGIEALATWIKEIGAASDISSLGVTEDMLEGIADASIILDGGYKKLSHPEVVEILRESL